MSVMEIDKGVCVSIGKMLVDEQCNGSIHAIRFFSFGEELELKEYVKHTDNQIDELERVKESTIWAWLDRLYLSNQFAFNYQYNRKAGEKWDIDRFTNGDLDRSKHLTDKELLEELTHIQYNLYTNEGRCFFSEEDMDKLNSIINQTMNRIIKEVS